MSKNAKGLIIGLLIALALLLGAAFACLAFYEPYRSAQSSMPEDGAMALVEDNDGQLTLYWPNGFHQDRYLVQVLQNGAVIQEAWTSEEQLVLPQLPQTETLGIRVYSARGYQVPFSAEEKVRMGTGCLSAEVLLQSPSVSGLTADADLQKGAVNFNFTLTPDSHCRVYYTGESGKQTLLNTLNDGRMTLYLRDDIRFSSLDASKELLFSFEPYRAFPGLIYYGAASQQISLVPEDLLRDDLALLCTDLGDHVFRFTWAATECMHYLVQRYQPNIGRWETVHRVEAAQDRSYTTDTLPRFSEYRYRVVAVGGPATAGSEYSAISAVKTVTTNASPKYSTIWPIQELKVYRDASRSQSIGTVPAAKAFCVMGLENGMFRILYGNDYGYIDSNYCLINLPELLGDLCVYSIANSTDSLYMAHEYELPTVTGEVIVGYENVRLKNGDQLVPLLYPVAQRLGKAAMVAIAHGYKLNIYDAFRPQEATIALYDQAIGLANQPIPKFTYTGVIHDDLPSTPGLTYGQLMTDFGRYTMNYFLAAGKSQHNRGIAVDLTLRDIATGKDLKMQTSMHDLSWYSELGRNNANSNMLADIMKSVGFSGLTSEWWHFNDLEAQSLLIPPYMMSGVNAECWMSNGEGLYYRLTDGTCYADCTVEIDGVSCTFDKDGYLVTQE